MCVLPVSMSVHCVCVSWLWKEKEGIGSLEIVSGDEPTYRCWEPILGPLNEYVVLTARSTSHPSFANRFEASVFCSVFRVKMQSTLLTS